MSAAPAPSSSVLVVCPSCGAAVAGDAKACWLCQGDLTEKIVTAEVVVEPAMHTPQGATSSGLIAGVVILGLVTVGVFAVAPGIGVLLGILFVMVTFAAAKSLKTEDARPADRSAITMAYASPSASAATRQTSVLLQVFKVLGIIALSFLASIIALFVFCAICIALLSQM